MPSPEGLAKESPKLLLIDTIGPSPLSERKNDNARLGWYSTLAITYMVDTGSRV